LARLIQRAAGYGVRANENRAKNGSRFTRSSGILPTRTVRFVEIESPATSSVSYDVGKIRYDESLNVRNVFVVFEFVASITGVVSLIINYATVMVRDNRGIDYQDGNIVDSRSRTPARSSPVR